ncbi:Hint domain-containing protein [Acetobacter conturbans]|uniref:Adhesin n=1 Tax=Acetobacter conturbans TaxID=1737472 RepID=A0ABX0K057_9PROT|nr:Hint domain-containing protein [Acetobacter conturbans]NHN89101.1 adhesin [Acetobacter conturbans]
MSTVTWTGAQSSVWTNAANWDSASVPHSYDEVSFGEGASVFLSANEAVGGLAVSGAVTIAASGESLDNGNYSLYLEKNSVLRLQNVNLTTKDLEGDASEATIILQSSGLTVQYGNTLTGTVIFDDVKNSDGTTSGSTIDIVYYDSSNTSSAAITGFSNSDKIIISGNEPTDVHLVLNGDGVTYSLQGTLWGATQTLFPDITLASGVTPADFTYTKNSDGSYTFACFLADSMIRTVQGDVPVQDIRIGDQIVAIVNGHPTLRKIVWTGMASVSVRSGLPDDEAGYPIRILKDAFSDNVPSKDMLITSEHCLFLQNRFLPARILVNGRSIFYDRSITTYDYYHIETEPHSVILADNVPTESYLDTGNRSSFRQAGKVAVLAASRHLTWKQDAAAPLDVTPAFTETLYRTIETRAVRNSVERKTDILQTTSDPDLHLMTARGDMIRMERKAGRISFFPLPAGVKSVRLLSRTSRPHDVIGPFVDDRRQLGVLVGRVMLAQGQNYLEMTEHFHNEQLAGWFAPTSHQARWTTGDARLSLEGADVTREGVLAIEVLAAGPYPVPHDIAPVMAIPA